MIHIRKIFHPTDFSKTSEMAFAHALKLALAFEGSLSILHVDPPNTRKTWSQFPKVRETLSKWGLLEPNASKEDLAALKLRIRKTIARGQDPEKAMLKHLEKHHTDLMVVATHKRQGLSRLFNPSIASSIAQKTEKMTLFLPEGVSGFVDKESGHYNLKHILIPVDHSPNPEVAFQAAKMLQGLAPHKPEVTLFHVSNGDKSFPECPNIPSDWKKEMSSKNKSVPEHIFDEAAYRETNCIVMSTEGRNGLVEALLGSTAERVIQDAPCPVLAISAV